jgi:hypothetical protein
MKTNKRATLFLALVVGVLLLTLLTACGSAEETGRVIGKAIREFFDGLWQGCNGSILLALLGLGLLISRAR